MYAIRIISLVFFISLFRLHSAERYTKDPQEDLLGQLDVIEGFFQAIEDKAQVFTALSQLYKTSSIDPIIRLTEKQKALLADEFVLQALIAARDFERANPTQKMLAMDVIKTNMGQALFARLQQAGVRFEISPALRNKAGFAQQKGPHLTLTQCELTSLKGLVEVAQNPAAIEYVRINENNIPLVIEGDFAAFARYLTYLNLSCNGITAIQKGTFDEMLQLSSLLLQNNQLACVASLFEKLGKLTHLNLAHNNFKKRYQMLPETFFKGLNSLTTLNVQGNDVSALEEVKIRGYLSGSFKVEILRQ